MRGCGDCVVCCVYLKIPALNKGGFEHCRHLKLDHPPRSDELQLTGNAKGGNCSINSSKPQVCHDYKCLWLLGHGEEQDRPDRSKILADTLHNIDGGFEVKQLTEGAADEHMDTILRLVESTGKAALIATMYERRMARVIWPSR
jgi:hypothetical protein